MTGIRRVSQLGTNGASTYVDGSIQQADISTSIPLSGLRNLLINGGMQINQRNAAVTSFGYVTDRWFYENTGSAAVTVASNSDVPTGQGFTASLRATTTTGESSFYYDLISIYQKIEGFNSAQLAFGTSSAKTVTLSFWVRSSVIGLHTFNLESSNYNPMYIGTYSIAVANTWEKKTITVPGSTTGTWLTNNGVGVIVRFPIHIGPSILGTGNVWSDGSYQGATGTVNDCATTGNIFAITGVHLEANSQPTPFEQRPIGLELLLCQRYYERISGGGSVNTDWANIGSGGWDGGSNFSCTYNYLVIKRVRPSVFSSGTGINCLYHGVAWLGVTSVNSYTEISTRAVRINYTCSSGGVQGQAGVAVFTASTSYVEVSAEL
jgi:hypothetical protein